MKALLLTRWKTLPPRKRKWIAWTAGLMLFYTIFGFLILPLIIKAVAVQQISKQLDREVSIRQVRINPYVLSGTIRGLLVKDKDGQPFLSLDEAYANFQLSSFFGKAWVFKEIWTTRPFCRVQINPDYTLNFSDLLTKFSKPSPGPKKPAKPLLLHISRFQITGATASFTDQTLSTPFQRLIGPIQIVLTEFNTDPNNKNPYSFTGTTDSGEKLSWSGQFSLDPLQSAGDLALEGLAISKYAPLFQDLIRFEVRDGIIDGRASYRFAMAGSNYIASVTNASFSLHSFKIGEPGNPENLVELDQFAVTQASGDSEARTAEVGQISLAGGRIMARRNKDELINLVQASEPTSRSTNAPGGVLFLMRAATNAFAALINSTNLWAGTIDQVDLTNCAVHWEDLSTPRPVQVAIEEIVIEARHLSNVAGSNQTAAVSFRWNTNGSVQVQSSVQLAPPGADLALNVSNVELHALGPYLEPFVNLVLIDSKVGIGGMFQMRTMTNNLPQVSFRGDARMDDFATVDAQTNDLLKWKSVQVSGMEANLQPPTVTIKQVAITDPFVRAAIDTNQSLNFLTLIKNSSTNEPTPASATPQAVPEAASPAKKSSLGQKLGAILSQALSPTTNGTGDATLPKVAIELISITNGFLQFNDLSLEPAVTASIQELNGTISDLSSEELKRADIHLLAKADRTGPIEINGKINPLSQTAPTQLQVVFKDVDLSPTSPYAGKFLGYRLKKGKLNVLVDYEVTQRKLKAKNVVMLDQLTLGEKVQSPDATKLPVKLAVALLKDRNGKIELDLPIEGDLDDPQFHFGKIILHVLGNVMTKIVTSPFAALGSMFGKKGGTEEDFSYQDFAPGSSELQSANLSKLDALVSGLYERPGLELQIEGSFDPVADGNGLRKLKLQKEFREQKWAEMRKSEQARMAPDQITLSPDEYRSFVQTAYAAKMRAAATNETNAVRVEGSGSSTISNSDQRKGAAALIQKPAPVPAAPLDEKEQLVLSSIQIKDEDYLELAKARAKNIQQKIIDSGKVEATRLSLTEIVPGPATNRASRVYFHLE